MCPGILNDVRSLDYTYMIYMYIYHIYWMYILHEALRFYPFLHFSGISVSPFVTECSVSIIRDPPPLTHQLTIGMFQYLPLLFQNQCLHQHIYIHSVSHIFSLFLSLQVCLLFDNPPLHLSSPGFFLLSPTQHMYYAVSPQQFFVLPLSKRFSTKSRCL